jgi:hypothetical protein
MQFFVETLSGELLQTDSHEQQQTWLAQHGQDVVSSFRRSDEEAIQAGLLWDEEVWGARKAGPSKEQIDAFEGAIQFFTPTKAKLVGELDDDGTLLLRVTEDGLTQHARFSSGGVMLGPWF